MSPLRALKFALVVVAGVFAATPADAAVDLSNYVRVARFDLPSPLAAEASAVTYNWDADTLFVVGDGSTAVVQVSKAGVVIDSMALSLGSQPLGDTEGIAYIGGGQFVMAEERERRLDRFTYVPNTTLTRDGLQSIKVATTTGNTGIEGVTRDPLTSGFVAVKEAGPLGVFQTGLDFGALTATNGSPTTENPVNLFDPALAGLADFADVFALSNVTSLTGADRNGLLILSQESGRIVNVERNGQVTSALTIMSDVGNPLPVADQGHEGLTMDNTGRLYVVSEAGGGDTAHPQLWVYAPSSTPNQAPTAIALTNPLATIAENTSTANRIKVADVSVTDDGVGTNTLSAAGPDASFFEADGGALYLKAGTVLNRAAKPTYSVSVAVDDIGVGATPDATSTLHTLTVTAAPAASPLIISEVTPWSSGNSPYGADWFEVTNTGAVAVDLTGYRVDDSSNSFASAIALNGVPSIAPGQSVIFLEGTAATAEAFKSFWGVNVPVGTYSGGGIGLSTDGDAVNLFNPAEQRVTGVTFGASTTFFTFDNSAGVTGAISALSVAGRNGAYTVDGATGSPGAIAPRLIISEVSPWSSGNSPYAADWFEVTNVGSHAASLEGFRVDDSSNAFASAIALNGVPSIAPGQSVIFLEGSAATAAAFSSFWGTTVPVGTYSGGGIGLSTDGDAVNLFEPGQRRIAAVSFGPSTSLFTFDNAAGLTGAISRLSVAGVNGAFLNGGETGSPGAIAGARVSTGAPVTGTVAAQLSLVLGAPATFAPFIAGVAQDYLAETTATVTSTGGDAALSVVDSGGVSPGRLVNGAFSLTQPLEVRAGGGAYTPVSATPATLLTWGGPVSHDVVTIGVKQVIGQRDALRTGAYAKTLTFTLSTSTP